MSCRGRALLSLGAAGVVVVVYVLLITSAWGQWLDDNLLIDAEADQSVARVITNTLHLVNIVTIGVLIVVVVVGAGLRHRLRMGAWAAGGFIVAVLVSEVLKRILPRPEWQSALDDEVGKVGINTFPSGHSTIVTAGVIALLWAWGARERWAWWLGGFVIVAVAGATVVAGWHRPSDAIGGIAVGISVMAAAAWISGCSAARRELNSATV